MSRTARSIPIGGDRHSRNLGSLMRVEKAQETHQTLLSFTYRQPSAPHTSDGRRSAASRKCCGLLGSRLRVVVCRGSRAWTRSWFRCPVAQREYAARRLPAWRFRSLSWPGLFSVRSRQKASGTHKNTKLSMTAARRCLNERAPAGPGGWESSRRWPVPLFTSTYEAVFHAIGTF